MRKNSNPSIAFVHDWLVTLGGAEQILAALMEIWPASPVFTLVYDPQGQCKELTTGWDIRTSFIQRLPRAKVNHRFYLPLMPLAVEQFDVRGYDVILSVSHSVAHGVMAHPHQMHINYICTPVRYAWHLYHPYLQESGLANKSRGWVARMILHYLRLWDVAASNRVDTFVAISQWVAQNVWRVYRRPAHIIYPPVDIQAFRLNERKEDYYLTASRLVPYKRIDLIVEAFNRMPEKKLLVVGEGPELKRLQSKAGENTTFLGFQPTEVLVDRMQRAQAFVFAAEEDFGILPVEAQACGTPVIAFGKGGARETIIEGKTGIFFSEPSVESLVEAIQYFEKEKASFKPQEARENAARFSKERFKDEFRNFVEQKWIEHHARCESRQDG